MTQSLQIDTNSNNIATIWLDINPAKPRGGVVVLDAWLIEQLGHALEVLERGPRPLGVLLRSKSERVFVAGADLAEIDALDDPGLHAYLFQAAEVFGRIAKLPCPTVAIVHAAALGGGLEVAMHCTDLVAVSPAAGAKPWRVGLPECGLGICPGWGGTQCLGARIDPAIAFQATAAGTTWSIDKVPEGLFSSVSATIDGAEAAATELIQRRLALGFHSRSQPLSISETACRSAAERALASSTAEAWASTETGRAIRDCIERGLAGGFAIGCEAEREHLVRLRHTPEAREKLAAFLKR